MIGMIEVFFEHARGIWRFRWWALIVAWVVALVAWTAILFLPNSYEARARVFVDTRTMLSQVTQGLAVDSNIDTQIAVVRQALIGGPQLTRIAHNVFPEFDGATPQRRQILLKELASRLQIRGNTGRDNPSAGLFTISYRDPQRDRALGVVGRILKLFVQDSLGGDRESSERAQHFLTTQIAEYEQRLAAAETRLATFKKQNVGLMPGAQGDYFTRLQGELAELDKSREALGVAEHRREELRRQLTGEQAYVSPTAAAGPNAATGPVRGNDTATRIAETQARLDELLLRFTDKYPDVIALRNTLAELKARQRAEVEALRRGDPAAVAQSGLSSNPVYQSIELQLNQANVEIAAMQSEIATHEKKVAELKKLVNTAPMVEAEFARLNRDYDVTREQYRALLERLDRTRLTEEAGAKGVVRFEIIDPPSADFQPVSPNRPRLLATALLIALGIGAGFAWLLHQLKPVFSSVRQLETITGFPVLGVVSMAWVEKNRAAAHVGTWVYACLAGLLVIIGALVLIFQSSATQLAHSLLT